MVRSGNSEHVRFRYGMCLNDEKCSKAKSKEIQTVSARKEFVCEECGKPLRECPPPANGKKTKLIAIIIAVIAIVAVVVISLLKWGHTNPTKTEPVGEPDGQPAVIDSLENSNKSTQDTSSAGKTIVGQPQDSEVKPEPPVINGRGTVDLGYGSYTGDLKNGKPHGFGKIKYTQRHKIVSSQDFVANPGDEYEGEFRDGLVSGGIGYWYHDGNQTAVKP